MSETGDVAKAVEGIVKAVPIYNDALQPAAKELGTALATVAKTVNVALAPLRALVWGWEQIEKELLPLLIDKLKHIPQDRITTPSLPIAGPAMEGLRFAGHEPQLRELYANLLATSMDATTAQEAHPGFVEIIRQLTPDEARILRRFETHKVYPMLTPSGALFGLVPRFSLLPYQAFCDHPHLGPNYLSNLERLGIVVINWREAYMFKLDWTSLREHPDVQAAVKSSGLPAVAHELDAFELGAIQLTGFGQQFCQACVFPRAAVGLSEAT